MIPLLESVEMLIEESSRPVKKKVVRNGELKIKFVCKPGFKFNPATKSCVRMTMAEKKVRTKAAKKSKKTKRVNKASIANSSRKSRIKSARTRKAKGLDK